jgi:hypothetical protein
MTAAITMGTLTPKPALVVEIWKRPRGRTVVLADWVRIRGRMKLFHAPRPAKMVE